MAFSKVTLNGETLMDVTDDTVAANNMLYGTRGTAANGTTVTGTVVTTPVDSTLDTTSHNAIENAAVASALALKADSSSIPSATSDLTNDSGFITTETDPVFGASAAATITSSDITNWNSKASSDTKVTQTSSSSNLDLPIILRNNTESTSSTTEEVRFASAVTVQPSTGNLKATTFNGYTLAAASAKGVDTSISAASSSANLPTSAAVASFVEGKGYLTSYTETDPVFSASAAATITSSDISGWNDKVSDDKTWNSVSLSKSSSTSSSTTYVPYLSTTTATIANLNPASTTPTAHYIAKYDANSYLKSTTPAANDNTTKVATTAFVSTAISNLTPSGMGAVPVYAANATGAGSITNSSGKITISESDDSAGGAKIELEGPALTLSATKDLDNTSIILKTNNVNNIVLSEGTTTITGVVTPTNNTDAANKAYVDSAVSSLTPVIAYTATLAAANWSNTTPSTYTYSNTSLTCGASGDVPPLITCTSNETEYSTITSASATPGTGITFTAPSAPAGAIGLVIIDYK